MRGKVKWFNAEKGFGFIEHEDNNDIFIHYSKIIAEGFKTLNKNDIVEFDLNDSNKGLIAENITLVESGK